MESNGGSRRGIRDCFESPVEPSDQTNEGLDGFWQSIFNAIETKTKFASASAMRQRFRCCLFRAIRDYESGHALTKG